MKNALRKLVSMAICVLCLLACKKDRPEQEAPVNGGSINRYELVTIHVGNIVLTKEEYQGTIAGVDIALVKSGNNELVFIPVENIPDGDHELLIPELNNIRITYTVKDPVLAQSADETVAPLLNHLGVFADERMEDATPSDHLILQGLQNINEIYEKAKPEQQRVMAMTYQANKPMLDAVFAELKEIQRSKGQRRLLTSDEKFVDESNDLRMSASRFDLKANTGSRTIGGRIVNILLFQKFSSYIITMGVSGVVAVYGKPYGWHTPVLAAVAIACAYQARQAFLEIVDVVWHNINVQFDGITGNLLRSSSRNGEPRATIGLKAANRAGAGALVFDHDTEKAISFNVTGRKLQDDDKNSSLSVLQTFFGSLNELVNMKTKVNDALSWCNDNIPFANFGLLPIETVPASSVIQDVGAPSDILDYLSFNIDHPNLRLVSVSLTPSGQFNIKVSTVDSELEKINSSLKFVYKDDLSSFEGSVPIEVRGQSIVGTWFNQANDITITFNSNKTGTYKEWNEEDNGYYVMSIRYTINGNRISIINVDEEEDGASEGSFSFHENKLNLSLNEDLVLTLERVPD